MNKIVIGVIFVLGLACLIGGSVFIGIFPGIMKDKINEEMPLDKGSDSYKRWQETPVPITMKFHFFGLNNTDYTSLDDIVLVERGPYTYEEKRFKQDISVKDDLITYRENKSFAFKPNQDLDENKDITFINFPLLGILQNQLAGLKLFALQPAYNKVYKDKTLDETDLFITRKPVDILFNGVPYLVFEDLAKAYGKLGVNSKYGIYDAKQAVEEFWTINSGNKDINKLGQAYKFDNKTDLTNSADLAAIFKDLLLIWPNKDSTKKNNCTQLKGTDGTLFAPDVSKDDILYAFEPQLCRPVFFSFWKETEVKGITTYRFKVDDNFYKRPKEVDANTCYCIGKDEKRCDRSGLLDVSHCFRRTFGAPIIMSPPYFKNGDPKLRNQFKADLVPKNDLNDDNYGTYLDIEPMTGTVLKAVRRLQMNIEVTKTDIKTMPQLANSNKTSYIVPVFWIEESGEADEDQANEFKSMVINKKKLANGISIAVIVVGALLTIVSVYLFIKNR